MGHGFWSSLEQKESYGDGDITSTSEHRGQPGEGQQDKSLPAHSSHQKKISEPPDNQQQRKADRNRGKTSTSTSASSKNTSPGSRRKHSRSDDHSEEWLTPVAKQNIGRAQDLASKIEAGVKERLSNSQVVREREVAEVYHKVDLYEAKCSQEKALEETLRGILARRRCRVLGHDGHFQVMDDDYSRDKLVKHFALLFDQADIASEKLEDLCHGDRDRRTIEEFAPRVFQHALKISFKAAHHLLGEFTAKLKKNLLDNLGDDCENSGVREETAEGTAEEDGVSSTRIGVHTHKQDGNAQTLQNQQAGLHALVKEYLRQLYKSGIPQPLYETTKRDVYESEPYKQLVTAFSTEEDTACIMSSQPTVGAVSETVTKTSMQSTPQSTPNGKIMDKFINDCSDLAWHFAILPGTFFLRNEDLDEGVEFNSTYHTHHSMSDTKSKSVKEIFWPALIMRSKGQELCLQKAVVITGNKAEIAVEVSK